MRHNAEEPGKGARGASNVGSLRELGEGLVNRVVGIEAVSTNTQAEAIHAVVIGPHQEYQRVIVAACRSAEGTRIANHVALPFESLGQVEMPISLYPKQVPNSALPIR